VEPKRWYKIQNLSSGITDVSIFDEIGIMGVTAQDFLADLPSGRGPLLLHLNSGGGEVFEGLAIYHALRNRGNVTVRVEGVAASIASVIAMAADPGKLEIAKRASMMIHNGFAQQVGDANDMRKMADVLEAQTRNIAGVYADRTGIPADVWTGRMQAETWYIGQQAVDVGLADRVVDVDQDEGFMGVRELPGFHDLRISANTNTRENLADIRAAWLATSITRSAGRARTGDMNRASEIRTA